DVRQHQLAISACAETYAGARSDRGNGQSTATVDKGARAGQRHGVCIEGNVAGLADLYRGTAIIAGARVQAGIDLYAQVPFAAARDLDVTLLGAYVRVARADRAVAHTDARNTAAVDHNVASTALHLAAASARLVA